MDIFELLDKLSAEITGSSSVPLSGKKMIDPDAMLSIIEEIKAAIPEEVSSARQFAREKQQLVAEVKARCETLFDEAKRRADALIEQDQITQEAYAKANEILTSAHKKAQEIKRGGNMYVDDILAMLEKDFEGWLETMRQNRRELIQEINKRMKD